MACPSYSALIQRMPSTFEHAAQTDPRDLQESQQYTRQHLASSVNCKTLTIWQWTPRLSNIFSIFRKDPTDVRRPSPRWRKGSRCFLPLLTAPNTLIRRDSTSSQARAPKEASSAPWKGLEARGGGRKRPRGSPRATHRRLLRWESRALGGSLLGT